MQFEEITDPLAEFDRFRQRAEEAGVALPEAMTLATVDSDGHPRARIVLFKGRVGRQIFFYTNYESDKARDLDRTPRAEVCFHYAALELQARLSGLVDRVLEQKSDLYFASRPRASQIGAWASHQSHLLQSRKDLDDAFERAAARFEGVPVPRPPHWGGFAINVTRVELWMGRSGRLHDRARYEFNGVEWTCQRLFP